VSAGIEVKKPIRFFFFFGLFLSFVLLGVRACNDRRTQEEVAEVEKILSENERELIPSKESMVSDSPEGKELNLSNSDELGDFESEGPSKVADVKKPAKPKKPTQTSKPKASTKEPTKPKSESLRAQVTIRPKPRKPVVPAVDKAESKKEMSAPKKTEATNADANLQPKMKILVSGQGYVLDGISQAKLKGAISLNSNPTKVKVLLFSEDPQGRSLVVKRAELNSALIRAGLSTSAKIEFEIVNRSGYAEVLFF
jgi:outer membrane biosynthesis protein TonB